LKSTLGMERMLGVSGVEKKIQIKVESLFTRES
jgi:hypothetical protein